jgi:hypothetical protein
MASSLRSLPAWTYLAFSPFRTITSICGLRHSFGGRYGGSLYDLVRGSGAVVVKKWKPDVLHSPSLSKRRKTFSPRNPLGFAILPSRGPDFSARKRSTDLGTPTFPTVARSSCESCGEADPAGRSTGCWVREKTTMKNLSDFVNGNGFAVAALILIFAVAIGVFQATIYLAK